MPRFEAASGGSGALTLIEEKSGVAASYDFQNIPGTYKSLVLIGQVRGDHIDSLRSVRVTFNNDTGANYSNQVDQLTGITTTGTALTTGDFNGYMAPLPSGGASAGMAASFQSYIPNYAGSTFQKTMLTNAVSPSSTSVTYLFGLGVHWYSTAAITRVTVGPDAGASFVAGSRVALYGVS